MAMMTRAGTDLSQETGVFIQVSHVGALAQALGPSCAAFLGALTGSWNEVEQGLEMVSYVILVLQVAVLPATPQHGPPRTYSSEKLPKTTSLHVLVSEH